MNDGKGEGGTAQKEIQKLEVGRGRESIRFLFKNGRDGEEERDNPRRGGSYANKGHAKKGVSISIRNTSSS